jgi:hypothetical protein
MNKISGRVVLKETGLGIPDLLVVIHDADPGTTAEDTPPAGGPAGGGGPSRSRSRATAAPAASHAGLGDRLGSRLTASTGAFEFEYEDAEFQLRNASEKRPDLLLVVVAPEEPGVDEASRVLYTSRAIRQNAGRIEQYLIRIPGDVLKKAGVPLPLDPAVASEGSRSVIGKFEQAVVYRKDIQTETRRIAAKQVDAAREQHEATVRTVESKVIESLIGVTAEEARRLRIVMPGGKPEPVLFNAVNDGITGSINQRRLAGYLVLTEEEAARFRDAEGGLRQDIPGPEIEPFIYKARLEADRPNILTREDPVAAICRAHESRSLFDTPAPPTGGGAGNGAGTGEEENGAELELKDLPKFISRLVNPVIPPEEAAVFGRPSADDVQNAVQGLQIKSGPADVAAFYDFHQLQIAFDYVWQHAIDDGVLEATNALARALSDAGADPVKAVSSGNPLRGLRMEALHVASARKSLQGTGSGAAPGVMMRMRDPRGASDPAITGVFEPLPPLPPSPPPKPPIVLPPFFNDDLLVNGVFEQVDTGPTALLTMLDNMLGEKYKFEVFAPGTTNFGLLVTYRQKWQPVTYQCGDLVKTLTLAPKETRKVASRRVVRKERSVKEMEANQRNRKDETSDTMRAESEIVQKAQDKTNFNATGKGSYNIGISKGDSTTSFTKDADALSQETKKSFHEAVMKAAQEFRDERKLEVETRDFEETEYTDSAEITNPNDELTCTFLFYELQRRYRVSEHINRLTPVVLVAMEVPNPGKMSIDRVLLSHAWIVNRVLLDDRYRPALDYLCTRVVGDELALRDLASNLTEVRSAVESLKKLHRDMENTLKAREAAFTAAIEARARRVEAENSEGFFESAFESIVGDGGGEDLESVRIVEDMKKDQYERAVREEKELRMRLDGEVAALTAAQQAYAKANAEHSNRLLQIAGLRAHFKENMLYYMQAIWSFTFKDQIFFQLAKVKVPRLTAAARTYDLVEPDELPLSIVPRPGQVVLEVHADARLDANLDPATDFQTLVEVADLDNPLGFKGNYMIFPLRQSNPLTDYMMLPYIDSELGLHDPDDLGSWTPQDFAAYARCLQKQLKDELTEAEFQALQNQLSEQYRRIVSSPRRNNEEIIVPTSSLYIEALPGAHPLLEDFKLAHRMIDVKKAQAEARKLELENLRYAARLLDQEFDDPDVERKIQVHGMNGSGAVIVPPEV